MSTTSGEKIDLSRFHETFFQESFDGLSVMEHGLLTLADAVGGSVEPEIINNVFRAAHSIKGSCGTFGFTEITELTHLLEAILDLMRDGVCQPHGSANEVLLRAVDGVRELMTARLEGRPPDQELVSRASTELKEILTAVQPGSQQSGGHAAASPAAEQKPASTAETGHPDLNISFRPHQDIFHSANDPLQYLNELSDLGDMTSKVDLANLPDLADLETTDCFLSWDVSLKNVRSPKAAAQDVFLWIEDRCDLEINEVAPVAEKPQPVVQPKAAEPKAAEPKADAKPAETKPAAETVKKPAASKEATSIRVSTEKVDAVVNLVGELVITQSMLTCIGDDFQLTELTKLREGLAQLTRNTRELQETVLKMRMLPISSLFERFPRVVHDVSRQLNKSVALEISGETTELDRTVLEKLSDPLVHLVRNSLDHGIERAEVREKAGKPPQGTLHLHAEHKGGNVLIEISDDGAGLNTERILERALERGLVKPTDVLSESEIHELIFEPGFSTAQTLSEISGRGVGLDVVRRNVQEVGGRVEISSRLGLGAVTTILLPLTLAILDGQLMRVGNQRFVVPLVSIIESVQVDKTEIHAIVDRPEIYRWRKEYLRVVRLNEFFQVEGSSDVADKGLLIIVESRGDRIALAVDDLLAQQQVVIKSLEANFQKVLGIAGATILGDGDVAMILDVSEIIEKSQSLGDRQACLAGARD